LEPWVLHEGKGGSRIVVAVPARNAETPLALHGALRRSSLAALLASDGLGATGRIALLGPDARALLSSSAAAAAGGGELSPRSIEGLRGGTVVEYAGSGGRHMIGTL